MLSKVKTQNYPQRDMVHLQKPPAGSHPSFGGQELHWFLALLSATPKVYFCVYLSINVHACVHFTLRTPAVLQLSRDLEIIPYQFEKLFSLLNW